MEKKKHAIFSDSTAILVLYSVLADWIIFTVILYNILYQWILLNFKVTVKLVS